MDGFVRKNILGHLQENGSIERTVCCTSKILTYSESSSIVLQSIPNHHSMNMDGLVRKAHQSVHEFYR